ncbi:MAG: hypothetical protein JWO06_802, partial [Bacteroidota bacterium]|nr:hypothetical protein [Bacteroidota bacterium]
MKKKWKLLIFISLPFSLLVFLESGFRFIEYCWPPVYQLLFDDGKQYLYVLGESTSLGVPYLAKISPAQMLSYQFNDSLQGKPIQTITLAMEGHNIEYNYFKFYFELLMRPHKNGLVFMYSGINENINNTPDVDFDNWKWMQHSIVLSKMRYIHNTGENGPGRYEFRYHQIVQLAKRRGF